VRARAGIRDVSSRAISTFAAVAILVAAQVSLRAERDAATDAFRPVPAAASLVALHSTATQRLTVETRSAARPPATVGTALPSPAYAPASSARNLYGPATTSAKSIAAPVVARGYDATAPPA
jgi:hypothetical protein